MARTRVHAAGITMRHLELHRRYAIAALMLLARLLCPTPGSADIAREPIQRIIARAMPRIRACFERAVVPSGRIVVGFKIAPDGTVPSAWVTDADPAVRSAAECVTGEFLALRFPTGGSLIMVTYPVVFAAP